MKYLKKLLDELENVMDQVETELQQRVEETPGQMLTAYPYNMQQYTDSISIQLN